MTPSPRHRVLVLAATAALAAAAPSQGVEPEKPKQDPEPTWPELTPKQERQVARLCDTLKRTKKQARKDEAEAELTALGSGVAPVLLQRLSDYRSNINEPLTRVLNRVTDASHAPLLARHVGDHEAAARTYVVRRLMEFRLPALAPVFREARKDRDGDIAFLAGLGLASTGDLTAIDEILERATEQWDEVAPDLERALPGARGEKATLLILDRVAKGEELTQVAGLRLLRYVAEPKAAARIGTYLDSESHNVKKAAINTLRVVVDKQPPLDKLSVFQAIEMAKAWQARI